MKFVFTFLLTVVLLVFGLEFTTFASSLVTPANIIISSSDDPSLIPDPETDPNVKVYHLEGDESGMTSIRYERNKKIVPNPYPPDSKTVFGKYSVYGRTYQQRDRDLGQTFLTDADGFTVDAVYLRVAGNQVAINTPGARVAIQFFQVTGKPRLNNHGTPGFAGEFNRKTSPELDDYLKGESYTPTYVATGRLPNNLKQGQYMKWKLEGKPLTLEPNSYYAFIIMFLDRQSERSLTLYNNYYGDYRPSKQNPLIGHSIRREGKPDFSNFWFKRLRIQPTTLGFPDLCTYRDLFFIITAT